MKICLNHSAPLKKQNNKTVKISMFLWKRKSGKSRPLEGTLLQDVAALKCNVVDAVENNC